VPLTTAPRYVRADENGSRHAEGQPLALLRDPGHRFSLDLTLRGAADVTSPTHALHVAEVADDEDGEAARRARLRDSEVVPDRDCVLTWRPAVTTATETQPALRVWLHADPPANEAEDTDASGNRRRGRRHLYFLALITPPDRRGDAVPEANVPREAVLLVDHSGSMEGAKWEAADWAVSRFLSGLTERETFALGLFHNTTQWMDKTPHAASSAAVDEAVQFLQKHRDSGGTELGVALEQALHLPRPASGSGDDEAPSRHVLLVTDAEVSDAGRILRLADEEARRADTNPSDRRRISVLCIDAAPNSFLASELAERGGGLARFLTSAPDEEDITTALDAVLDDWAAPVVADLRLYVNRPHLEASGRAVRADGGIDLGDLPAAAPFGSRAAFPSTATARRTRPTTWCFVWPGGPASRSPTVA
jgi:Ca-activated chloride channel family protein